MTLTEFLLARIAEDEAFLGSESGQDARSCQECGFASDFEPTPYRLSRLLAECEAKRRIVEAYGADDNSDRWASCGDQCEWHALGYAMRALALPYADHPDYRQEWKP